MEVVEVGVRQGGSAWGNDVEMNGDMEADLRDGTIEERQQSHGFRACVGDDLCVVKSGDKGWVLPRLDACRTLDTEAARNRSST
jgi:hypothetical protein